MSDWIINFVLATALTTTSRFTTLAPLQKLRGVRCEVVSHDRYPSIYNYNTILSGTCTANGILPRIGRVCVCTHTSLYHAGTGVLHIRRRTTTSTSLIEIFTSSTRILVVKYSVEIYMHVETCVSIDICMHVETCILL